MSQNSESQTLDAIKKTPGLSAVEIGKLCHPRIALNTVEKNVCHIRGKFGETCIETIRKTVVVEGVKTEIATYYWRERDEKKNRKEKHRQIYADLCAKYLNNPEERIKILEQAINELDEKHLQRLRIREQIENLTQKQAVSGARKPDRVESGE